MIDEILKREAEKRELEKAKGLLEDMSQEGKVKLSELLEEEGVADRDEADEEDERDEKDEKYILEPRLQGDRCIVIKKGKDVKLYSHDKKDITKATEGNEVIAKQVMGLSEFDCILDGMLNEDRLTVFDVLYYENKCTMILGEYERKKLLLNSIKETENIKRIRPYLVGNREQGKAAIEELSLKGSGVMVKRVEWDYTPNGNSNGNPDSSDEKSQGSEAWMEYVKESGEELSEQGTEVKEFPQVIRDKFNAVPKDKWLPYSICSHYRGHEAKEGYQLDSLHEDITFRVSDLDAIGFIITTSKGGSGDMVKGEKAKGGIRFLVKEELSGYRRLDMEGIVPKGLRGATESAPGFMVITGKGEYRVLGEVEDHKLRVELKSDKGAINLQVLSEAEEKGIKLGVQPENKFKDLEGIWQFQIAHIEARYVGLLKFLGNKMETNVYDVCEAKLQFHKGGITKEGILSIAKLTEGGKFRSTISKEVGVSKSNVYVYQKLLGYI